MQTISNSLRNIHCHAVSRQRMKTCSRKLCSCGFNQYFTLNQNTSENLFRPIQYGKSCIQMLLAREEYDCLVVDCDGCFLSLSFELSALLKIHKIYNNLHAIEYIDQVFQLSNPKKHDEFLWWVRFKQTFLLILVSRFMLTYLFVLTAFLDS
jgi:hypothetical protein